MSDNIGLNGVFVQPTLALRWDHHKSHLQRMAALGLKQIIFQWTSAHGYSLYPSQAYQQEWGLSDGGDWLEGKNLGQTRIKLLASPPPYFYQCLLNW